MRFNLAKIGTFSAGLLAATFMTHADIADARPGGVGSSAPHPEPIASTVADTTPQSPITIHASVQDDPGIYARDLYLAYVKSPNPTTNLQSQSGLFKLAAAAYGRTSVEPAGVVAIDIEKDDLSLFPFIYWPVSEQTPRLSPEARAKIQDYTGRGNLIIVDLGEGSNMRTSETLRTLLSDMQVRPVEQVADGHLMTQSFYITEDLPGTSNREVFAERTAEDLGKSDMTTFIIGNQNWAGSWSGVTVGPDVAEDGLRSGLNMLFAALMGTYKLDDLHLPTIEEKREFQRQHDERLKATETPAPTPPQQ